MVQSTAGVKVVWWVVSMVLRSAESMADWTDKQMAARKVGSSVAPMDLQTADVKVGSRGLKTAGR